MTRRLDEREGRTSGLFTTLQAAITRRSLLRGAGLTGAAAAGGAFLIRAAAQEDDPPTLQTMLDDAITLEAFAVTFAGAARDWGRRLDFSNEEVRFLRAIQCEDEAHFHFFESEGAAPHETTFSIANATFADRATFYEALLLVKEIMVGAHMALARGAAALGDLRLVEVAYQIGVVEAQHQAIIRGYLGKALPTDRAFAQWRFHDPAEAVAAVEEAGFIGGSGKKYTFPGPVDRICRDVFGLVPETSDARERQPRETPAATPPAATPTR